MQGTGLVVIASPRSDSWRARPGMSQIRGGVTKILSVKLFARDDFNVAYT